MYFADATQKQLYVAAASTKNQNELNQYLNEFF